MTSQHGKQTITKHILANIKRGKENHEILSAQNITIPKPFSKIAKLSKSLNQ